MKVVSRVAGALNSFKSSASTWAAFRLPQAYSLLSAAELCLAVGDSPVTLQTAQMSLAVSPFLSRSLCVISVDWCALLQWDVSSVFYPQCLIYEAEMFHHSKCNVRKMGTPEWGRCTREMWEVNFHRQKKNKKLKPGCEVHCTVILNISHFSMQPQQVFP